MNMKIIKWNGIKMIKILKTICIILIVFLIYSVCKMKNIVSYDILHNRNGGKYG